MSYIKKQEILPQMKFFHTCTIQECFTVSGGKVKGKKGDQYCFKNNNSKILAVAHCDTVQTANIFCSSNIKGGEDIIFSPKLDDRIGVFTILYLLPKLGISVDTLLTENEEAGLSTATLFNNKYEVQRKGSKKQYNWIVQFDRAGDDVVDYSFNFSVELNKYFKKVGYGSYTDICELQHLGCKAFNIGVGYNDNHSMNAYMYYQVYLQQIMRFLNFYKANRDTHFSHTPAISTNSFGYNFNIGWKSKKNISSWKHTPTAQEYVYEDDIYSSMQVQTDKDTPKNKGERLGIRWCRSCKKMVKVISFSNICTVCGEDLSIFTVANPKKINPKPTTTRNNLAKGSKIRLIRSLYRVIEKVGRNGSTPAPHKVRTYMVGSRGVISCLHTQVNKATVHFKNKDSCLLPIDMLLEETFYTQSFAKTKAKESLVSIAPYIYPIIYKEAVESGTLDLKSRI